MLLTDWLRFRCWKAQRLCVFWLRAHSSGPLHSASADDSLRLVRQGVHEARQGLLAIAKRLPFSANRKKMAAEIDEAARPLIKNTTSVVFLLSYGGIKHGISVLINIVIFSSNMEYFWLCEIQNPVQQYSIVDSLYLQGFFFCYTFPGSIGSLGNTSDPYKTDFVNYIFVICNSVTQPKP